MTINDPDNRHLIADAEVSFDPTDAPGCYPAWRITTPDGVNVMLGRYEDEHGAQLYVSINTEDLADKERDLQGDGCPLLNVSINGGDVYDREAGKPAREPVLIPRALLDRIKDHLEGSDAEATEALLIEVADVARLRYEYAGDR